MSNNKRVGDTLQEREENAQEELEERIEDYVKGNQSVTIDEVQDDVKDDIPEIADAATPVYTAELDGLWELYYTSFEEAYKGSGIGNDPRENDGMTAISIYLEGTLTDWLYGSEGDDFIEDLLEKE